MIKGFSPYQLDFGTNLNYLQNKVPELESVRSSEIIAITENLNAMWSARQGFVSAQASEKISRTLRYNVTVSNHSRYSMGDPLFYKIYSCEKRKGPGKSIGQGGSEAFVKHESISRVYPCRLGLENYSQYQRQIRDQSMSERVCYIACPVCWKTKVPRCLACLHSNVPCVLTCLSCSYAHVSTCLACLHVLHGCVPTSLACLHALHALWSYAKVSYMLIYSCVKVAWKLTYLCANMIWVPFLPKFFVPIFHFHQF